VKIDAVGISFAGNDIAAPIEQRKGVARFERARPAFLKGDIRLDIERRRLLAAGLRVRPYDRADVIAADQAASRAG
jgi:hypothetical protein